MVYPKMWKLLRNLLLAAILVAGMLKLLAWYEVGQDAQRVTAALAPYAQLRYDSISAGLDGSINLNNVTAAVKRDNAVDTYSADHVVLESPGVFWLLKHALFDDSTMPPHFGISVQGLKIPPTPWLDPHWFNPATLVPFETTGCTTVTLAPGDYRRMEVSPADAHQHGEYRYDPDTKTVGVTLALTTPGSATLTIDAELRQFEPKMLQSSDALKKVHVEQVSLTYSDAGYFKKRNALCAQRANIGPGQFAEQHVAAVQALLQQHGIEASADLLKIYRRLVDNGGQASILSLPNNTFVAGAWFTATPEDMLRQMNITTRYGDAPPVMFRLNFPAPPQAAEPATAIVDGTPTPPVIPAPVGAVSTAPPSTDATPAPKAITSATTPPPSTTSPPLVAPAPARTATTMMVNPPPMTPLVVNPTPRLPPVSEVHAQNPPSKTALAAPPPPPVGAHPHTANGLEEIDRAEALLPPPPKREPTPAEQFAAQPAPAAGSTLALVWKPTIERLPTAAPERHDYDLVEFGSLKGYNGRFVRLITEGGKKVEGYVVTADESDVQLRVARGSGTGGDAIFTVPKTRIQQIQLLRRTLPPA
jgi:hypothetical protein